MESNLFNGCICLRAQEKVLGSEVYGFVTSWTKYIWCSPLIKSLVLEGDVFS